MAIEVSMSSYVCRWCGCPYSLPSALSTNPSFTQRCPLGHDYATGRPPADLLREVRAEREDLARQLAQQRKYVSQLKGQITRLKNVLARAQREAA